MISSCFRYGFVRGLNSPTPKGTPVHAIDDGVVRISGIHSGYSSRLVQVSHVIIATPALQEGYMQCMQPQLS